MSVQGKSSVRSKKGFALATVVMVISVIVIIAASLIGLAVSSTTNTSANIDERQAYLNAKSALDYGAEYYSDGTLLPEVLSGASTGEEYIIMKDVDRGTAEDGAEIVPTTTDVSPYKTYVYTLYDKSAATLKLTAYAKSSSAFGSKEKSTTLSVTYNVGSSGTRSRRQLSTVPSKAVTTQKSNDSVSIHVRRDPNATGDNYFNPAIYTWSYYAERNGNDFGVDWNNVNVPNRANTDWNQISVDKMNQIEYQTNMFEPAGNWLVAGRNGSNIAGPKTKMDPEAGSNDWFVHTFSPSAKATEANGGSSAEMVPWFSMIVSRQSTDPRFQDKKNGSQSAEFLNVWYFDESDRNIYVEMLQSPMYYYKDRNWDGKTNLEDYFIAYANAPQTVYYVKQEGVNDNSLNPSISISGYSGGNMTYSGFGWWSFRSTVSGSETPAVSVTTGISTITVPSVTSSGENPIMNRTAYIVIDSTGSSARSFVGEEAAAIATGDEDYVTVYAKAYRNDSISTPSISYKVETHTDSAAKRNLKAIIDDADLLYKADYTSESWDNFIAVLNAAKEVYNNATLQSNATYNSEATKVEDAKNALSFKPVDVTELQKLIDEANTKSESEYTNETYSAMVTVRDQAQALVNLAAGADGTVKQSEVELKEAALREKIDALESVKPYQDALSDKIQNAEQVAANNTGSPAYQQLVDAINDAKSYLNSNSKYDIENAVANLTDKINRVINAGDTSELKQAIENANKILTADDASAIVTGTFNNLKNITDTASNMLRTTSLTQNEADSYTAAINDAIRKIIYIPEDSTGAVAEGKKRVWFDLSALNSDGNYYIYLWGNGEHNVTWSSTGGSWRNIPETKIQQDAATGYYYYDMDDKYQNIIVVVDDGKTVKQTEDLKYDENNNLIIVNGLKDSGKTNAYAKMATLYVEKDSPWNSSQYAYVYDSSNSAFNSTNLLSTRLSKSDDTDKYYIQRIAYDSSSKFYIHSGTNYGNNRTTNITLEPSEMLILYPNKDFDSSTNVTADVGTLSDMLKREPVSTVKATGKASASKASYNGSSASVVKTDTTGGAFVDSAVPSNSIITVYFKKPSGWGNDVMAEVCQIDDSGNVVSGTTQGNLRMVTTDSSYYSIKLDANRVNAINISNGSSGTETSALKLAVNSSGVYHNIQLVSENGGSFRIDRYTATYVTISTADVTFDSSCTDLPMAFVGGKKQVFNNKWDDRSGRKDMCGNPLNSHAKFSNTDDQGYARVGLTTYSTYYDWYEYKIPAGESDLYTFRIKGLNKSESGTVTKQVHQVWGDVWVSLTNNADKESGKYKVNVATVNPENNVTQQKTTIYVTQNPDLVNNHGGMQVTMWGTESQTVKLENTYDGRYYVEVPQNMPFLQFSSVDGSQIYEMTKLQGGDKILYDYSAGAGGAPTWLTYVPANIALQRERANAESVGNGWILYDYNYNSHAISNTYAPMALINLSDLNDPANQSTNPSTDQARANFLASWTNTIQELYNKISEARGYITIDGSGNPVWYPESDSNTSGATYSEDSIKDLYNTVHSALVEYANANADLNALKNYITEIDNKIKNLEADISQKAVLILEDVEGWASNGVWVQYTDENNVTRKQYVSSTNSDGYPLIYVNCNTEITNVQFGYGTSTQWGGAQPVIKAGEIYVYNNSSDPAKSGWTPNTSDNYFMITTASFVQSFVSEEKFVGDKATADDFTIYFTNNTKVTYKQSAGSSERTYTIPAGAYGINLPTYRTYYTGGGSAPDKINLYSETAEKFFTDPKNQGMSTTGAYSDTLGWTSSGNITNHSVLYHYNGDVNFIADSGSLNGSYSATGSFYFRWNSDNSSCSVRTNTSITASSFTFASPKSITAGSTIAPKFKLKSSSTDPNEKLKFTFLTDVNVNYKDSTGQVVEFTIRQGSYEAVNSGEVNFFDKDFWTTGVVEINDTSGSGGQFLSNPIYSIE